MAEISEYDKYNNPALADTGPIKPKKEEVNKYESHRRSQAATGTQNVIEGRSMQEYTPTGLMSEGDNYGQVAVGQNLNDTRAHMQSTTENMFSSLAKAGGLVVSTVGSLATTLPEGIVRASIGAFDPNMSTGEAVSKLYDNTSAEYWDKFNGGLDAMFPVYKPESYEKDSLLQNMGTSQFWGETVLKNAGFTGGALIGGGIVAKGLQAFSKIAMGARLAENTAAFRALIAGGETPFAAARKVGSMIPYAVDKGTQIATGAIVSFGEASMEAKPVKDELQKELTNRWKAKQVLENPNYGGEEPTGQALSNIVNQASSAGNVTLGANMAVLTGLETFQFGRLWTKGFKEEIDRVGKIAVKDGVSGAVEDNFKQKAAKYVGAYGKNTFSEAAEEGIQTAVQAGTKDYYSRKYDKNGIASTNDSILSVLTGMQETFGTKGGLESMLAGAITGIGSHAVTSTISKLANSNNPSEFENATLLADRLTKAGDRMKPYLDSMIRQHAAVQAKENNAASPNPSRKIHEDENANEFRAFVQPYIETGSFDLLEDKLNQEYAKDEERFKLDNGEGATRKSGKDFVAKLVKDAKKLKNSWDAMQDFMPKADVGLRERMWSTAADIDNRNERFNGLNTEVLGSTGVNYIGQPREEYLAAVAQATPDVIVNQKAGDVVDLFEDKKALAEKYKAYQDPAVQEQVIVEDEAAEEEKKAFVPEVVTPIDQPAVDAPEEPAGDTQDDEEGKSTAGLFDDEEVPSNDENKPIIETGDNPLENADGFDDTGEPTNDQDDIDKKAAFLNTTVIPLRRKAGKTDAEILKEFKSKLPTVTGNAKAALEQVIKELEEPIAEEEVEPEPEEEAQFADELIAQEDADNESAIEASESNNYSEADWMAATGDRTTADHLEAINKKIYSVLRYQNFLNNPRTTLLDGSYRLMVVTPKSALYNKLLDKKNKEWLSTPKEDGSMNTIEPDGVITILVNTATDKVVITDAGGKMLREISQKEYADSNADVDDAKEGAIVSKLVKEVGKKELSNYNAVSYRHFGLVNGFGDRVTKEQIDKDTTKGVGKAWTDHVRQVATNRALMTEGKIKYLKLTNISYGAFINNGDATVSNNVDTIFDVEANDNINDTTKFKIVIPSVPGILSKDRVKTTTLKVGNKIFNVLVGRPYLIVNDRLYPLKTRVLNPTEINNVIKLFNLIKSTPAKTDAALLKIKQLVYIKPVYLQAILDDVWTADETRVFLAKTLRQIDKANLKSNAERGYGTNSVTTTSFKSSEDSTYRDFLFSGDDPALTINFRPHPTTTEMMPNFMNGYLEYSPIELNEVSEPAKAEEVETEEEEEKLTKEEQIAELEDDIKRMSAIALSAADKSLRENLYILIRRDEAELAALKGEVKPEEQTPATVVATPKTGGKRVYQPVKDATDDELLRRKSLQTSDKKEDIEATKKWWKNAFGDESLEVVDSLIKGKAFGEYTSAMTKIFSGAEVGTGYHEAFHKVTQEYLTPKQLKSLYDDVRKTVNSKFTDLQAEEYLAEDFRNFMLSGQTAIKGRPITNSIFRKLYNYLRTLLTGKTTPEQIYNKLAKGQFNGAKKFNVQQFTKLYSAIPGLTHQQTNNIVESINSHFFNILFDSGKTPNEILGKEGEELIAKAYKIVYSRIVKRDFAALVRDQDDYEDEEYNAIGEHYDFLLNITPEGVPTSLNSLAIKAHKDYLKGLGIYLGESVGVEQENTELEKVEGNNAIGEAETQGRSKADFQAANEDNTIYSTPNSIKLLVMSLPEIDVDGNPVANNIGGPKLNDYRTTLNILYAQLAGLGTYEEQWDKLAGLTERFPVFRELMKRLGEPGSDKSQEQFLLEQDFRQSFHKSFSKGTTTLINEKTGAVYQVDANANKLADRIKEIWTSNLRVLSKDADSYVETGDDGIIRLSQDFVEGGAQLVNQKNVKEMLRQLGIEFTDLSQEDIQNRYDNEVKTNDDDEYNFKENVDAIYTYIKVALGEEDKAKQFPINDLFSKKLSIKTRVDALIELEQQYSKETVELSYLNAEGKRIYAVSLNNFYSLTINHLNNSKTLAELYERAPHLNVTSTRSSQWIKGLFDKKGNKVAGVTAYMNTQAGLKQQDDNESGKSATSLTASDKIVQEINDALTRGTFALIRPADKAIESAIGISSYNGDKLVIPMASIAANGFNDKKLKEVFLGYFNDELASIREFRGLKRVGANIAIYGQAAKDKEGNLIPGSEPANKFRLFADILSPKTLKALEAYKTNDDELPAALLAKISQETVTYLEKYASDIETYLVDRKVGKPYITDDGIQAFTGIDANLTLKKGKRDSKMLEDVVKTFVVNHLIQMQEQSKLLIGDSAFYKDKIKRISAGTGTKKFAANSPSVNKWFNAFYKNTVGRVDGKVADGLVNVVVFGDVVANERNVQNYIDALIAKGVDRKLAEKIMKPYFNMEEGDAQGWITLDEYREFMKRVGGAYWTALHEKQYRYEVALERQDNNQELNEWQTKAIAEGNPNFYFMPIKAQYSGPQVMDGLFAPAFHKYSLAPLYHSLVKGRNMEDLLANMRAKKIGYGLFGTGSKVGSLLNAEGKLPAFYNENGIAAIDDSTPIQQIYYDYLGIQLDIAPKVKNKLIFGSQFRKLLFSNLFGAGAKAWAKPLADEYNRLIDNQIKSEFNKLVKSLGISATLNNDGEMANFSFKGDYKKLVEKLKVSLEDKDTADNILDSLQTNEDGSLVYPIDALVNRDKIEKMLFSIVNNKVIKQKTLGNALVQLASSGFEGKGKRTVGESNYLEFYQGRDSSITVADKIIFGHPTIGKTFLKSQGNNKFISLDDDYAQDIKDFIAANKKPNEDKYQYQERKPKEFVEFTLALFDTAKAKAAKEGKQLFTSNNIILDKRGNEFDKVVDLDREEFFNRIGERNTTYDVAAWKDQIDALISKVDPSKVVKTKGYLSDLFEDGTTTKMQVEIPMNDTFRPLLDKYKGDLDALNAAMAAGEVDERMLTMIGYRIPTQGLNSMDVMIIKRFMIESSGVAIILPSGVVAKSGGDYDIDKLNIFMPNIKGMLNQRKGTTSVRYAEMYSADSSPADLYNAYKSNKRSLSKELVAKVTEVEDKYEKKLKESMVRLEANVEKARENEKALKKTALKDLTLTDSEKVLLDTYRIEFINAERKLEDEIKQLELVDEWPMPDTSIPVLKLEKLRENYKDASKQLKVYAKEYLLEGLTQEKYDRIDKANKKSKEIGDEEKEEIGNLISDEIAEGKTITSYDELNTKEAVQNRILEIAAEVLTHPDNFIDLVTPNTTDTLVNAADHIRWAQTGTTIPFADWIKDNKVAQASTTKQFRFDWIMDQFDAFLGGKAALGVAATHNTHHILSQIADVFLNAEIPFKSNTRETTLTEEDEEGNSVDTVTDTVDLSKQYTVGGQKISDLISQFINAYVDVAKDPFYQSLNAGTDTVGVWMYMIRAGMDIDTISYFMTQPIIKDYVAAKKFNSSILVRSLGLTREDKKVSASKINQIENSVAALKKRIKDTEEEGEDNPLGVDDTLIKNLKRDIKKAERKLTSVYNEVLSKYGVPSGQWATRDFKASNINEVLIGYIQENARVKEALTKTAKTDISKLKVVSLSIQPDNVEQVLAGTKTTTIRSEKEAKKIGLEEDETGIINFKGKNYYITHRGAQTIEEAGGKDVMLKSEGVGVEENFKFDQSRKWVNGEGTLHVYDFKEVDDSSLDYSDDFRVSQTGLLQYFVRLEEQASGLTELMQVTNSDTKSVRSFGSLEQETQKRIAVDENTSLIPEGTAARIRKSTIVGSFDIGASTTSMYKELGLYMSNDDVFYGLNEIANNFDKKLDYEKEWTKLQNDFIGYLTQKFGQTTDGEPIYTKMDLLKGDNSLARQLIQLNREGLLEGNPFTEELIAQVSAKEGQIENIKMYSRRLTAFESNVISEAFRELLSSNNPRLVEFGQNLAYLTIVQSGLQNSPITFTELIPHEFYGNIVKGAIDAALVEGIDMPDFTVRYKAKQEDKNFRVQDFGLNTKIEPSGKNIPKGAELQKGVFINQEGLNEEEQLELFNMIKPLIESSAAKTNKGANANYMMGLGLRWDYKTNNPTGTPVTIGETLKGFNTPYGYYKEDINGNPVGSIPARLKELITKASGIDISNYDGAIINIYTPETFINRHPDQDESVTAGKYPVVAVNIGGNGNFSIGNGNSKSDTSLNAGAAYVFGFEGKARQEFHGTSASDIEGFLPELNINHAKLQTTLKEGSYRITLTMRRVMPLTKGMPSEPILGDTIVNNVPEVSAEQKELDGQLPQQADSNVESSNEVYTANQYFADNNIEPASDAEYADAVISYSTSPEEIANQWLNTEPIPLTNKQEIIKERLVKTTLDSLKRYWDKNQLEGRKQIIPNYVSKTGRPLDRQAKDMSTEEVEITEADLVEFIDDFPSGQLTAKETTTTANALAARFEEVTGKKLTVKLANELTNQEPEVEPINQDTKLFNPNDKELKRGSVVTYNKNKYILWNVKSDGKAQLINYETGVKFTGTPLVSKLVSEGAYKTVDYNTVEYIVVAEDYIYSTLTGNLVYAGNDNSSKVQRERIFALTQETQPVINTRDDIKSQLIVNGKISYQNVINFIKNNGTASQKELGILIDDMFSEFNVRPDFYELTQEEIDDYNKQSNFESYGQDYSEVRALASQSDYTIKINFNEFKKNDAGTKEDLSKVLNHELIHILTVDELYSNKTFKKSMEVLMEKVIDHKASLQLQYGMSNVYEFVAEAMTNPEFQEVLAQIPTDRKIEGDSIWTKFVSLIKRTFNPFNVVEYSVLDATISSIQNSIAKDRTYGGAFMENFNYQVLKIGQQQQSIRTINAISNKAEEEGEVEKTCNI